MDGCKYGILERNMELKEAGEKKKFWGLNGFWRDVKVIVAFRGVILEWGGMREEVVYHGGSYFGEVVILENVDNV
jgi:hypothetical protein